MRFFLIVFVGILAISMASILIKLCSAPAMAIASYRLLLAACFFLLVVAVKGRSPMRQYKTGDLKWAAIAGAFLCMHFVTWITSLKYTSVASSVVLVATSPVFVGIGSIFLLGEKLTKWLIAGIALTLTGAIVISTAELQSGDSGMVGNGLAMLGGIGAAGYLLAGRKLRAHIDTVSYVSVVYSLAAVGVIAIAIPMKTNLISYNAQTFGLLFLIAAIPQVIGHTTFNWALQHVSATTVSVLTLGEPIGAPILAFFLFGEKITAIQLFGGMLILTGVVLVLRGESLSPGESQ